MKGKDVELVIESKVIYADAVLRALGGDDDAAEDVGEIDDATESLCHMVKELAKRLERMQLQRDVLALNCDDRDSRVMIVLNEHGGVGDVTWRENDSPTQRPVTMPPPWVQRKTGGRLSSRRPRN